MREDGAATSTNRGVVGLTTRTGQPRRAGLNREQKTAHSVLEDLCMAGHGVEEILFFLVLFNIHQYMLINFVNTLSSF